MIQWGFFMALDKKKTARAYESYYREALYCLIVDVLISLEIIIIACLLNMPILIMLVPLMFLGDCFINYRIAILSLIEKISMKNKKIEVKVVDIKIESSWSGWNFESVIPKLYPQKDNVLRYKIVCFDTSGKKKIFRIVMSRKKYLKFLEIFIKPSNTPMISITYGQFTRIVLYINAVNHKNEEICDLNYMF